MVTNVAFLTFARSMERATRAIADTHVHVSEANHSYSFCFLVFLLTRYRRTEVGVWGWKGFLLIDQDQMSPRYRTISYGYIVFSLLASTQEAHGG